MPALVVEVVGDTSKLTKDLSKAEAQMKGFARRSSTIKSTTHLGMVEEIQASVQSGEEFIAMQKETQAAAAATSASVGSSALAFGLYGVAANAAFDGLQRISGALKVTGDRATTTKGQVRNFFAELTSGHPVSALLALDVHNQADSWQEAKQQLDDYTSSNRSWLAQQERATHGVSDFLDKMDALFGMDRKMDRLTEQFNKLWEAAHPPTTIPFGQIAGGTFGIDPLDHLIGKAKKKGGLTAAQRRGFFDARIAREIDRTQDIKTVQGQVAALRKIAAEIQDRIDATNDVTRKLNLADQLAAVNRQAQNKLDRAAADAAAAAAKAAREREQRLREAAAAAKAAVEAQRGWLDFALEKAEDTKTKTDNLKALRDIEAFIKERIRIEGRTLDNVRDLYRTRKQIRDLNKKEAADGDPLAGLMQVSSARLTSILAAGTGLGAAGRRVLSANIAGAELRPLYVSVQLDGREVGRAVTKQQTRTSARTAKQTSGFRG